MKIRGRKQRKEVAAVNAQGLKLLAERRREEAYDFLQQAVQRFPDDAELRLHYATSLLAVRPESAVAEAVKAIELDPGNPLRLTRAASLVFSLGEIHTARTYATRAKELASPGFAFYPELINLDGHFAALDGRDQLAEEAFRQALEQEPGGEMFAVDLAKFLSERGQEAEALGILDEALIQTKRKEPLERLRSEILHESGPSVEE